eukprot:3882956-Alexandrium_andersonii.AAC.1
MKPEVRQRRQIAGGHVEQRPIDHQGGRSTGLLGWAVGQDEGRPDPAHAQVREGQRQPDTHIRD